MRKWDIYGTHLEKGDGVKGGEGGVYKYKVYRQKKKMPYKSVYNMFTKINDFHYN